jgi:hypothetical protein
MRPKRSLIGPRNGCESASGSAYSGLSVAAGSAAFSVAL